MHAAHTRSRRRMERRAALVTLALLALVALASTLAACGGIEGTYTLTEGDDTMKDFTLKIEGDEFTLSGPDPSSGGELTLTGTYTVEGDKISLTMQGQESEVGTIDGNKLVFDEVTWEK